MESKDKKIEILRSSYSIGGDGVAKLKLSRIKGDAKFKQAINALSKLDIKEKNREDDELTEQAS